jgi:carboxylate-amine ligase
VSETVGATFGVEEEYHLVDPQTYDLMNVAELSRQADEGRSSRALRPEMLTSQLEAVTDVCTDLDELAAAMRTSRREAAAAAAEYGATILATSTHPFATLDETEVAARPRYRVLLERFGAVVGQLNLTGCHVHVGVPDPDLAIAIMTAARPYLPVLSALTGSSAFHEGHDTGFESFRLAQLALWPQGGLPPQLDSSKHHHEVVDQLTRMGLVDEPSMVLWELRPSDRYPTLEFRIADVCTDADDALLFAGLTRSLVRVLAARISSGLTARPVDDVVLRGARWRAARYGLTGELWSFRIESLLPAATVVGELWDELEADLAAHGEAERLRPLLRTLLRRGTSTTRQRAVHAKSGDLRAVARDAVELTLRDVTAR